VLTTTLSQIGLIDYLSSDNLEEAKSSGDEATYQKVQKENYRIRFMIVNSVTDKIHEDLVGIQSVYSLIGYLKADYDKGQKDLTKWIEKLMSIKAKRVEEIPRAIINIKRIYSSMSDAKATMQETEKIKYFIRALPKIIEENLH